MKTGDNKAARASIKITGLYCSEEGTTSAVQNFFKNMLKIEETIEIDAVKQLEKGTPPPIIVRLQDHLQKKKIFKKATNLKGVKNQDGKYYGIFNLLKDEAMEQDICKRQIVKVNESLPVAQRHKIQLTKGKLIIDGGVYKPKYQKLTATDLLSLQSNEIQESSEVGNVAQSDVVRAANSQFQGFAIKVNIEM